MILDTMSIEIEPTRDRILSATLRLLAEGGGTGVRISDIARAAGISRQALYLHFPNRAELLIAAARHLDQVRDLDARLAESRAATSGRARLEAFIRAWAGYLPEMHPVGRALMAMQDDDAEAAAAWADRMDAFRQGCAAAVAALEREAELRADLTPARATDLLAALLSVRVWEELTRDRGWSAPDYLAEMLRLAEAALIESG